MPDYACIADVQARSRANLAPQDDPSALLESIEGGIRWASARIDSLLGARFRVPFIQVPPHIREIAADLAAYWVLVEIYSAGGENQPTLLANELKSRAMEALSDLASGKAVLSGYDSGSDSQAITLRSNTRSAATIAGFDLVNRPCGGAIPLAPYKRW